VFSIAALGLLFVVEGVLLSLLIALAVDGIGMMLTIRKLRRDPTSEPRAFWALAGISGVFSVLSLEEYVVVALLFPVYVIFISLYIFLVAKDNSYKKMRVNRTF